jgi:hypothetical protein
MAGKTRKNSSKNGAALRFEAQLWAGANRTRSHMVASLYEHLKIGELKDGITSQTKFCEIERELHIESVRGKFYFPDRAVLILPLTLSFGRKEKIG